MLVPPFFRSKPPVEAAIPYACSSNPERRFLLIAAYALPLLALIVYARSFWGSPAFGELADQGYHLELGRAFTEAWRAGEFPPRWSATANGGRGSPAFLLYPPLFPCLSACWMRTLAPDLEALRWSAFTSVLLNFLAIYWAGRAWLSTPRACAAAGLALLLPGATFVALGRGMFPNFLALGWAAIVIGAAHRAVDRRRYTAVLALAGSGLALTHTPTAYLTALLAVTFSLSWWRSQDVAAHGRAILAGAAALLLTAWFWAPMLQVAGQAQTSYLAEAHPYGESLWLRTTTASTPFERDWAFLNETAAFVGMAQLVLAAGLLLALPRSPLRHGLMLLAAWAGCASVWPTGEWLAALPHYGSIQFCWRWQPLLSLGCALGFASLPVRTALRMSPLLIVTIGLFAPLSWPSDRRPGAAPDLASNLIEMRPIGASRELFPSGAAGRVDTPSEECHVTALDLRPSLRRYRVFAASPCRLRILTYHFPGWKAMFDEADLTIRAEPRTGMQLLEIPRGRHTLVLRFRHPLSILLD